MQHKVSCASWPYGDQLATHRSTTRRRARYQHTSRPSKVCRRGCCDRSSEFGPWLKRRGDALVAVVLRGAALRLAFYGATWSRRHRSTALEGATGVRALDPEASRACGDLLLETGFGCFLTPSLQGKRARGPCNAPAGSECACGEEIMKRLAHLPSFGHYLWARLPDTGQLVAGTGARRRRTHRVHPASPLKSPSVASLAAAARDSPAGSSSEPFRGFTTSDHCAFASNVAHISTKPS